MTPDPKADCVCGRACSLPDLSAEPWARLVGYGNVLSVRFHLGEAEAAGEVERPLLPETAPKIGDQVWLELGHPFPLDSDQSFWSMYECPMMVWNGPEPGGDELAQSVLVRFRILRSRTIGTVPGRMKAAALVEVLATLSLDELAAMPLAPVALDAANTARLLYDTDEHQRFDAPVRQGDYVYLANFEYESDWGQWAILRDTPEGWELLVASRWGRGDTLWAGRVRLGDLPPALREALDAAAEPAAPAKTPDPKFTCVCGRACAAPRPAAEPWARIVGYGDGGAVTFHRGEAEAADKVERPPPPDMAPKVGDEVWVQLAHPFDFDPLKPVWGLYESPLMVWNGPEPGGEDLARSALVRFRIIQATIFQAGDGRRKAAARVEVLTVLQLDHLAAMPLAPDALDADAAARLIYDTACYQHFSDPVRQGDYVYLANSERESDGGQWAILRDATDGWELLVAGRWGFEEDLMWAGRVRLDALPPALEKALDQVRAPPPPRPRHPPHGPVVQTKPQRRRFWWGGLAGVLALGVAGLLGVLAYQGDQPMRTNLVMPARAAFSMDIPAGCQMTEDAPGSDFQVYRVRCGGVEYAGVYAGNAPDPTIPRSRMTATEYAWPAQVQTWSREVPEDQEKADRISASVSVRAMN